MTITAKYLDADKRNAEVTLEPGDHIGSLHVQAETTIPAYGDTPEQHIPAGQTTPFTVPCDDLIPVWVELLRRIEAGEIAPIADYEPPPAAPVVVNAIDFWRRMTPDEGAKVEQAMQAQPFLKRQVFLAAQTFRSDAPEWPELMELADALFTPERKDVILAPSQ